MDGMISHIPQWYVGKKLRSRIDHKFVYNITAATNVLMDGDMVIVITGKKMPHIDPEESTRILMASGANLKNERNIEYVNIFNNLFEIV